MDEQHLREIASDQLARILGFFSRIDSKASVVLAVDTGMLAFLASKLPPLYALQWWDILIAVLALLLLTLSLWNIYREAFPSLEGGHESLVYFREIAKRTEAKFIEEFKRQTQTEHTADLLGQIWRNSEILKEKFDHVKLAFVFLSLAILPWVVAVALFTIRGAALH